MSLKRTKALAADPEKVREFQQRARANSSRKRRPVSPASPEQRDKTRNAVCVNCGQGPCDPAHLTPRSRGGCDHPDCVLPLCRACHRAFDEGEGVDLASVLALREFAAERAHMALHLSYPECLHRLTGERWCAESYVYEGWLP